MERAEWREGWNANQCVFGFKASLEIFIKSVSIFLFMSENQKL